MGRKSRKSSKANRKSSRVSRKSSRVSRKSSRMSRKSSRVSRKNKVIGIPLVFGSNESIQLGLGDEISIRKKPGIVQNLEGVNIVDIACGSIHNAAIDNNGHLWTWGCNDEKALGRDTDTPWIPDTVNLVNEFIVQVTCGDSHTVVLTKEGKVYGWGTYRSLNGTRMFSIKDEYQSSPILINIPTSSKIIQIGSCANYSVALTKDGEVWGWGFLMGGGKNEVLPILIVPKKVSLPKIKKIWTCEETVFAMSSNKRIFVWGLNNRGQGGFDPLIKLEKPLISKELSSYKNICEIRGGMFHTLILTKDGNVFSMGENKYGQLGLGEDYKDSHVPRLISSLEKIVQIGSGSNHSLAVSYDGTGYAWGFNEMYQLSTGQDTDEFEPVKITGQQLDTRVIMKACGGSQHTLLLSKNKF